LILHSIVEMFECIATYIPHKYEKQWELDIPQFKSTSVSYILALTLEINSCLPYSIGAIWWENDSYVEHWIFYTN